MADIAFSRYDGSRYVRGMKEIDPNKASEVLRQHKASRSSGQEIPQGGSTLEILFVRSEVPANLAKEGEGNKFFLAFDSPTMAEEIFEDS